MKHAVVKKLHVNSDPDLNRLTGNNAAPFRVQPHRRSELQKSHLYRKVRVLNTRRHVAEYKKVSVRTVDRKVGKKDGRETN